MLVWCILLFVASLHGCVVLDHTSNFWVLYLYIFLANNSKFHYLWILLDLWEIWNTLWCFSSKNALPNSQIFFLCGKVVILTFYFIHFPHSTGICFESDYVWITNSSNITKVSRSNITHILNIFRVCACDDRNCRLLNNFIYQIPYWLAYSETMWKAVNCSLLYLQLEHKSRISFYFCTQDIYLELFICFME